MGVALAPLELVPLGGEPALELGDDAVHGGQVLDRAGGKRAVELGQRPLRRQRGGPLDQPALELAAQVLLEAPQLLARDALAAGIVVGEVGLGLGAQAERAADPLDVDAEHARALAAAERGDRQPGQVAHRGVRAVPERRGDLLAQRVEVDLAVLALAALPGVSEIRRRAASASAARKKNRSNTRSNTRRSSGDLAIVAASASLEVAPASVHGTWLERRERVEHLRGPERDALLAEILGEREQLAVESARAVLGDARVAPRLPVAARRRTASRGSSLTPTRARPCRDRCGA